MNDIIIAPCGLKYVKDDLDKKKPYLSVSSYRYESKRYGGKSVLISVGDRSDGATGAIDIPSCSWWVHDQLCVSGCWDDGTKLSNWQCSTVLYDILKSEGRWVRAWRWRFWTFLFGGGKCRKNGMFNVRLN